MLRGPRVVDEDLTALLVPVLLVLARVVAVLGADGEVLAPAEGSGRRDFSTEPGAMARIQIDAPVTGVRPVVAHVIDEHAAGQPSAVNGPLVGGVEPAARVGGLEPPIAKQRVP